MFGKAQKALRRRLEELKKGGDALGMRQLPGNTDSIQYIKGEKVSNLGVICHLFSRIQHMYEIYDRHVATLSWYPFWFGTIPLE